MNRPGGDGFISGAVTINAGGALAPGSNNVGTLTLKSNLTLNAGAILNFEFGNGIQPNDRIAITNNLVLEAKLNVTSLGFLSAGNYLLMTYAAH